MNDANFMQTFFPYCDVHPSVRHFRKRKKCRVRTWLYGSVTDRTSWVLHSKAEEDECEFAGVRFQLTE